MYRNVKLNFMSRLFSMTPPSPHTLCFDQALFDPPNKFDYYKKLTLFDSPLPTPSNYSYQGFHLEKKIISDKALCV